MDANPHLNALLEIFEKKLPIFLTDLKIKLYSIECDCPG